MSAHALAAAGRHDDNHWYASASSRIARSACAARGAPDAGAPRVQRKIGLGAHGKKVKRVRETPLYLALAGFVDEKLDLGDFTDYAVAPLDAPGPSQIVRADDDQWELAPGEEITRSDHREFDIVEYMRPGAKEVDAGAEGDTDGTEAAAATARAAKAGATPSKRVYLFGHGSMNFDNGFFRVPERTTVSFHVLLGRPMDNANIVANIRRGLTHRPVQEVGPGEMCPNHTMIQDQSGNIRALVDALNEEDVDASGMFVQGRVTLADIIKKKGPGYAYHWLACRNYEAFVRKALRDEAAGRSRPAEQERLGLPMMQLIDDKGLMKSNDAVSYGQYRYERSKQTDSWDRKDVIAASTLKGRVLEQQVPSADWVILRLHTKIRDETTTVLAELPSDLVRRAAAADAPVLARADLATLARRLLGKQLDIRMGPSRQPFASDRHRRTRVLRINPEASVTVS